MNTLRRVALALALIFSLAACGTSIMGPYTPDPGQLSPDPGQYTPDPGQYTPDPGQYTPDPGQ
jgi:predicted small lipoprotein YifL